MPGVLDPHYVAARSVLLDVLEALGEQRQAVIMVERRLPNERRCLRHPPIHRCAQRFDGAMDRRELDPLGVVRSGLEAIDRIGLFERIKRQLAEVLLEHIDATARRVYAFQRRWLHAPLEVSVQKTRDVLWRGVR